MKRRTKKAVKAAKPRKAKYIFPIDEFVDEDLLRKAIEIDLKIRELNRQREEIRAQIIEMMDANKVTASNTQIAFVNLVQREHIFVKTASLKSEFPEIFDTLDGNGYISRSTLRYCQIHPKF